MLLHSVAVAGLSRVPQITDWTGKPPVGRGAEPEPRITRHRIASATPREQLVTERACRQHAAVNRTPALYTACIPEPNLKNPRRSAVDVPLDPHPARGVFWVNVIALHP